MTGNTDREILYREQSGYCWICGGHMTEKPHLKDYATFDHLIPDALGGLSHISNYALAHRNCNSQRGSVDFLRSDFICWLRDSINDGRPHFLKPQCVPRGREPKVRKPYWHPRTAEWLIEVGA